MPIATIALREPADIDQEALHFDPFRDGAGIVPAGFFQAVARRSTPPASSDGPWRTALGARPRLARGATSHSTATVRGAVWRAVAS